MGVSNVNTANKAQIIKLALSKKSAQNTEAYKPEYMKMTGSIFNAKNPDNTKPTVSDERANITELNTRRSLGELKAPVSGGGKKKIGEDSFQGIDDVSSGKAAISTGRAATKDVEGYTAKTEKNTGIVKGFSKSAQKLGDNIKDNDKIFTKKLKADQKEFEKDNDKIKKIIKENEETQKTIDDAQHELDGLLARNSFSMNEAGRNNNSGRIQELQTLIGSKVCLMQKNGKAIYSLQRSQSKTLSRMNKTNKAYINNQKINQKNIQSQEKQTNSIIDVAQQIEQYSAMAQAGGQALNLAGDALIALGQGLCASLFGSAAGAAMVTVGGVMKKVGTVLELVGQYGQTAANLTKTAAYAAEGNLMGAMMSCASAIQSGTAAVKSTTQIGKTWDGINDQINAAKQTVAAKEAAKETVKGMSKEELGGMSEKQMRKQLTAEYKKSMADAFTDQDGNILKKSQKELEEFTKNKKEDIKKTVTNNLEKIKQNVDTNLPNATGSQFNKQVLKEFKNKTAEINKYTKEKLKTGVDWGSKLQSLGSSAMTIATVFMKNQAMNEMSNPPKKRLEPYQMDARTRRIMQRNQRYRMHASYV